MADEPKQGKGIGELFVDFGAKGLGGLLKGLNTISASFLLTKNAAEQAIKPVMSMSQKATGAVTHWSKLSATMGMSLKELQDIEIFSKLNNVDFDSYINQIKTVQQKLIDIRTGQSNDVQGLTMLGLTAYDFDPRKPLEFLDKVKQRVQQVDEVTGAAALRWLGLDENLLYVWQQGNDKFNERLKLNDKELKNLEEQQKGWNILSASWDSAQNKFMANQTWINKLLEKTSNWLDGNHPKIEKFGREFWKWLDEKHPYFENLMQSLEFLLTTSFDEKKEITKQTVKDRIVQSWNNSQNSLNLGDYLQVVSSPTKASRYADADAKQQEIYHKMQEEYNKKHNIKPSQDRWKITPGNLDTPMGRPAPSISHNTASTAYNININQNITGDNPQQIASISADKIQDVLNSQQYQNQWNV